MSAQLLSVCNISVLKLWLHWYNIIIILLIYNYNNIIMFPPSRISAWWPNTTHGWSSTEWLSFSTSLRRWLLLIISIIFICRLLLIIIIFIYRLFSWTEVVLFSTPWFQTILFQVFFPVCFIGVRKLPILSSSSSLAPI